VALTRCGAQGRAQVSGRGAEGGGDSGGGGSSVSCGGCPSGGYSFSDSDVGWEREGSATPDAMARCTPRRVSLDESLSRRSARNATGTLLAGDR
jgi:hypothetical protein